MKCKRCGGDFPHKRGTYCGECEPDARPVGETAERGILCAYCGDYATYATTDEAALEAARQTMIAHDAACPRNPLVTRIRELESAAEARAALLSGAPEMWVVTPTRSSPGGRMATWLFTHEPSEPVPGEFVGHGVLADDALAATLATPPGTCVRYRLVPDPEEPHD